MRESLLVVGFAVVPKALVYRELVAPSKRNSRSIVVNAVEYRWSFSMDSGYATIVVQHGSGSGQRIEATTGEWHWGTQKSITPAAAAALIKFALSEGWEPTKSGSPLRLRNIDRTINLRAVTSIAKDQ